VAHAYFGDPAQAGSCPRPSTRPIPVPGPGSRRWSRWPMPRFSCWRLRFWAWPSWA